MPLDRLIAREGFDGADTDDVDGRTPDGGGDPAVAVGAWLRNPSSDLSRTLAIRDDEATTLLGGYTLYQVTGIPSLPTDHASEIRARFPSFDTPSIPYDPPCGYFGHPGSGGSPDFTVSDPDTYDESVTVWFRRTGSGVGYASLEFELSNGTTAKLEMEFDGAGNRTVYLSYHEINPLPAGIRHVERQFRGSGPEGPHDHCYTFTLENGNGSGFDFNGDPFDFTTLGYVYGSAQDGRGARFTSDVDHSTRTSFASSFTGDVEEYPSFPGTLVGGSGDEYAYAEAVVRSDPAAGNNYSFTAEFEHDATIGGGDLPAVLRLYLYVAEAGVFRILKEPIEQPWDHADRITLKLEAVGATPVLVAKAKRAAETEFIEIFRFNVATDLAWEDDLPVTAHATGDPGLDCYEESVEADGRFLRIEEWSAYGESVPCTGPPENPYPTDPPPSTPQPWGMYERKNLAWYAVRPEDLSVRANLAHRAGSVETKIRANLDWRAIAAELEEWPVPDTDVPPYFDPCQQLTPIPPGDVEPIPLTGRFIGISHAPVSILGPVLNGTRFAAGPWTPADLAACAARGAILTTAPGGRAQYLAPGGYWDLGAFIDGTLARLLPILSVLQDATAAGHYHGHSLIDDFESEKLWPKPPGFAGTWTGVPHGDIATALVIIRSECPGIRLGVRGRPSQFAPANLGFDFYEAAYKAWSGLTPTAFVNLEYTLAMAWGSFIHLSANFLHGGDGSSGIQHNDGTMLSGKYEMSAAEVASYTVEMYDRAEELDNAAILAGTLGYEYTNTYLTRTGMVDAFTIARNRLAALPALP